MVMVSPHHGGGRRGTRRRPSSRNASDLHPGAGSPDSGFGLRGPREDSGRPITHWTPPELADEAKKRGIVESISPRSVGRFLGRGGLKPHRIRYWLNNERAQEPDVFDAEVKAVCDHYARALLLREEGIHLVSTDEKRSIQALESLHRPFRRAPD